MKKYLIAILMAMPLIASAQDNTWERIEQVQEDKENPDAKYLASVLAFLLFIGSFMSFSLNSSQYSLSNTKRQPSNPLQT